jgi:CRISPR-associated endonuclease/helicase Cas3
VYAKSGRLPNGTSLRQREFFKDYRHEFGSLLDIEKAAEFCAQSEETKELITHFIAAHHGRARPHFPQEEAFDVEGSGSQAFAVAAETPRRFARLQCKYGRWGLAYLESLLRAADYAASIDPSKTGENPP